MNILLNSLSSIEWQMGVVLGCLFRISIQASILVLIILLIQTLMGRHLSAAWRYRLWFLVILRLVLPFSPESHWSIYNWLIPIQSIAGNSLQMGTKTDSMIPRSSTIRLQSKSFSPAISVPTGDSTEKASPQPTLKNPAIPVGTEVHNHANGGSSDASPGRWLLAVWLTGIGLILICITAKTFRLVRAIRHLPSTNNTEAMGVLDECRQIMRMHKPVPIIETRLVHSPGLWVFSRALLLIPKGMLERLSKQEMKHVFLHEMAHLRRRDILWNWIAAILQTIHWFNPVIWLAVTRMRSDQELACDAVVLEKLGQTKAREYGQTILKLLEGIQSLAVTPGIVGILEDPAQMKRRITRIACFKHPKKLSLVVGLLVTTILGTTTLTNARTPKAKIDEKTPDIPEQSISNQDELFCITGNVTDADTHEPISEFNVILGSELIIDKPIWHPDIQTKGSNGSYTIKQNKRLSPRFKFTIFADGYLPQESELQDKWANKKIDFVLKKGKGPEGFVLLPDGKPATNAQVAIANVVGTLTLSKASLINRGYGYHEFNFITQTDMQGHFSLPAAFVNPTIVAVHEKGYGEIQGKELAKKGNIQLQSWGKIEGTFLIGNRIGTNENISIGYDDLVMLPISFDDEQFSALTDEHGRFYFDYVPPGLIEIFQVYKTSDDVFHHSPRIYIDVKTNETTKITFGGKGRPLTCKLVLSDPKRNAAWEQGIYLIFKPLPQPPIECTSTEQIRAWRRSREYKEAMLSMSTHTPQVNKNGLLRFGYIPAGKYSLIINVIELGTYGGPIACLQKEITLDEIPGGVSDEPLDLGTIIVPVLR